MPFEEWKARHQKEATPEQLAAFEAAQRRARQDPPRHADE
jgi:hypothetical protein